MNGSSQTTAKRVEPFLRLLRMKRNVYTLSNERDLMKRLFLVLSVAVLGLLGAAGAFATAGGSYSASLQPIPHDATADGGSNVTGSANMFVMGRQITVDIRASGLTPGLPHAMHIHGVLGDANVCPPATADT
ncbi:MAG: superoxide dismutase family protein, partial [Actinobacteria bacterium]|nr:superoxide dismutase family protein [Actinomycetota bacterium]